MAINDCLIIESFIYKLLKYYFKGRAFYLELIELLHTITWKTELGQLMDLMTAPENNVNLERFSIEK
jgi:farnesyl diphosphate synthase